MSAGGSIELRLLPFEAPTNAARFARLARAGYFDGLTFHRVVPGFVIQGGSPGANEYVGDGPYTRDELTLRSHVRGTVGVSTRGRDTGDGQIFINLVDNFRLDHNYTIFAEVVQGMDIVDALLEGATIERIVWR
jgi:cyclophilin family peptidyl-prolyl cis-trans isomerase